jgi:hypothetical protein
VQVTPYTTLSCWRSTADALRWAAAYNGQSQTRVLHRIVTRELRRAMREGEREGVGPNVERPSHQPPIPLSLLTPRAQRQVAKRRPRRTNDDYWRQSGVMRPRADGERPYPYRTIPAWRDHPAFEPSPFLLWLEAQCRQHRWTRRDLEVICGLAYNSASHWLSREAKLPDVHSLVALADRTHTPLADLRAIIDESRAGCHVHRVAGTSVHLWQDTLERVVDRLVARLQHDPQWLLRTLEPRTTTAILSVILADLADYPDAVDHVAEHAAPSS